MIIDKPSSILNEDTMYVDELTRGLKTVGIESKIFVVSDAGALKKVDFSTGVMRILNSNGIVEQVKNFDIVHVQFSYPLGFAFAIFGLLRRMDARLIVHTHGYDVFSVPQLKYGIGRNMLGRWLLKLAWLRANRLITVCEKARERISSSGVSMKKIDVLYNGINENLFSRRSENEIPEALRGVRDENDFLFLTVGSDFPVKNQHNLAVSFDEFQKKVGSKFRTKLLIVGKSNRAKTSTDDYTSKSVLRLGALSHKDLPFLYSICDAFILPSFSEAHPWSLLEAMACELVVMGSNVGGIPETIGDEQYLLNPYDRNCLVEKMELAINMNKSERRAVGLRNRQRVLESFTLTKHIECLKKVYLEAIRDKLNVDL